MPEDGPREWKDEDKEEKEDGDYRILPPKQMKEWCIVPLMVFAKEIDKRRYIL